MDRMLRSGLIEHGKKALPEEIRNALTKIEGMPGEPAPTFMRNKGFKLHNKGSNRRQRKVYTHSDAQGIVFKIAVDYSVWQNNVERSIWYDLKHPSFEKDIPPKFKDYLAPILAAHEGDKDCHWIIMEKADMRGDTKQSALSMMKNMVQTGWAITDYHPNNFGIIDGDTVAVDYGNARPLRYLRHEWEDDIRDRPSW